jgi:hypothetical protein
VNRIRGSGRGFQQLGLGMLSNKVPQPFLGGLRVRSAERFHNFEHQALGAWLNTVGYDHQ